MTLRASQPSGQELRRRLDAFEGRLSETEAGDANLLDALERRLSAAIEKRLADHEEALERLREKREDLGAELRDLASGGDDVGELLEVVRELDRIATGGGPEEIGEVNVRLNAALKRLISCVEVGHADDARDWIAAGREWADGLTDGRALPGELPRRLYAENMETATVSIGVGFRAEDRRIVIAANPRTPGRFVAGAARTRGDAIEDLTLKVWRVGA